jgi:hypothetical protein
MASTLPLSLPGSTLHPGPAFGMQITDKETSWKCNNIHEQVEAEA